jgi:hypothetical protein
MKAYMCCIVDMAERILKIEHVYTTPDKAAEHKELFDESCFISMCYMKIVEVELD